MHPRIALLVAAIALAAPLAAAAPSVSGIPQGVDLPRVAPQTFQICWRANGDQIAAYSCATMTSPTDTQQGGAATYAAGARVLGVTVCVAAQVDPADPLATQVASCVMHGMP